MIEHARMVLRIKQSGGVGDFLDLPRTFGEKTKGFEEGVFYASTYQVDLHGAPGGI